MDTSPQAPSSFSTVKPLISSHFKEGGTIKFNLNGLENTNKPISNRLALLALTLNHPTSSQVLPKVFYSTKFKNTIEEESSDYEYYYYHQELEGQAFEGQASESDTRKKRSTDPVVETFRETRVFKMEDSQENELWLDITREIPRWKREYNDPVSVLEITVTYFYPGGDDMTKEIKISTEDASLVIFSKDNQNLEELQQESVAKEQDVGQNGITRGRRSVTTDEDEDHTATSLLRAKKHAKKGKKVKKYLRKHKSRRGKKRGGKRRNKNKMEVKSLGEAKLKDSRNQGIEKSPDFEPIRNSSVAKLNSGCHLDKYVIDFTLLGWDSWIIYPKKYDAFQCTGACPTPIDQSLNPTNHGMLQSLLRHKTGKLPNGRQHLCCVPSKLGPLSMLYMENGMVVTRHHPDMVVEQCACR